MKDKMTGSLKPDFEGSESDSSNINDRKSRIVIPIDLSDDSDYKMMLEFYQSGEFSKSREKLTELEKKYPGNPELLNFKDSLQMKLSVKNMEASTKKTETRQKVTAAIRLSAFFIFGTLFVLVVFFFSYNYLNAKINSQRSQDQTGQLASLYSQAEQLLRVGKPQSAAGIIETMKEIDPEYENLTELSSDVEAMLALEARYQAGLDLLAQGNSIEALRIFQDIEAEEPGMWDVRQQIATIETSDQIALFLIDGNAAYQEQHWVDVISAYESALNLDPNLDDPIMKDQLLQSYLSEIIRMLQSDSVTIEDVEIAETYYRKAVSLIPQSKGFTSERENLQEVSSNLLQLKFGQTSKEMLYDPNQTLSSIEKAVTYLRKAANIDPTNSSLQKDLKNAELYQAAFQDFINRDWIRAITNLTQLIDSDAGFANGNAQILLYESYFELGKQYYTTGFYQDAINNLEQAEIVTWSGNNQLRLFQVQLKIGDSYGKINDFANAVSYYLYALNAIGFMDRPSTSPDMAAQFTQASYWAEIGNDEEAYTVLRELLGNIDSIYTNAEVVIGDGVCLALFAAANSSTMDAVLAANDLPNNVVINLSRVLTVPSIE